jgi:hypothetical protein
MGAWGTAVFSDDSACDARDGFRELVAEGYSSEDATARLVAEYQFPEVRAGESAAQWIGLAVTQWKTGRLLDWVRDRAVAAAVAESGELWASPADWKRRQKVLAQTVEMLNSPQRPPVKIKRETVSESPFAAGDIVRFTLDNGREVALWALCRKETRTLVRVHVETPFILLGFGDPTLGPIDELVAGRPVLLTNDKGHSSFVQFSLWLPQDAKEPRWSVIGNAAVPDAHQDPRRFHMPLRLRGRGLKADEQANAIFSYYYEAWQRTRPPDLVTAALLELGELVPNSFHLWDAGFSLVPKDAADELADRISAGDTRHATVAFKLTERQLNGPPGVRRIGVELIDRLLCVASHPETGLARDRVLELLGPSARTLIPKIDAAWHTVGGTDRWNRLDAANDKTRRHAQLCSRRLDDGTYVICDYSAWSKVHGRPGESMREAAQRPDVGPIRRHSPAKDV